MYQFVEQHIKEFHVICMMFLFTFYLVKEYQQNKTYPHALCQKITTINVMNFFFALIVSTIIYPYYDCYNLYNGCALDTVTFTSWQFYLSFLVVCGWMCNMIYLLICCCCN